MTLAGVVTGTAERYTVVNRAVVANLSGFTDNNAHAVVNKQTLSDFCTRVNFNASTVTSTLRDDTGNGKEPVFIKPMCFPITADSFQTGIRQQNFQCAAGSWVFLLDDGNIFF